MRRGIVSSQEGIYIIVKAIWRVIVRQISCQTNHHGEPVRMHIKPYREVLGT